MANIKAPNDQYEGFVGGVKFSGGKATTTDEHMIQWFEARGYEVVKDAAEENLPLPEPQEQKAAEEAPVEEPKEQEAAEEAPVEEPKEQEAAEEAPAKPKRSRKGS